MFENGVKVYADDLSDEDIKKQLAILGMWDSFEESVRFGNGIKVERIK